ncbi:MAG: Beta-peptidyl aminopeptidase BapA [Bryobacteraceae bacterium]|nr:Beta-peptidyl aminopeptidase BapA [Bryobacteraceae bacterium]
MPSTISRRLLMALPLFAQPVRARRRARELGIKPGVLPPGKWNAITDVAGVRAGHATLIEGDSIRTGVTAILPHTGNLFQEKAPAAVFTANAFGKLAGSTQVEELGNLETPIILTNTLSVAEGIAGAVEYTLSQPGNENVLSVNAVVGETNDGYLNDIRRRYVKREHVIAAIRQARDGPVEEGAAGAGTGTVCFGFKGGIGSSSRILPRALGGYTIGVLVQTNFGGILEIVGAQVGRELGRYYLKDQLEQAPGGSCMVVAATDAPLDARNLRRLASRAVLGLGQTGSSTSNGSGEYVIAFSTAQRVPMRSELTSSFTVLSNDAMSPLFQAVKEATEEAVYNSLFMAKSMKGFRGRTVESLPIEPVSKILRNHRLIED